LLVSRYRRAWLVLVVGVVSASCAQGAAQAPRRTLPVYEPPALPEPPQDVPAGQRGAVAVVTCVEDAPTGGTPRTVGPGIMLSTEMALHAARLRVSYDELRAVCEVDRRMAAGEREAYQRVVDAADEESALWRERSRRTWFERNGWWVGMIGGVVVGAGTAVGIAAALDAALGD